MIAEIVAEILRNPKVRSDEFASEAGIGMNVFFAEHKSEVRFHDFLRNTCSSIIESRAVQSVNLR